MIAKTEVTPRRGFRPTFSWLAERLRCQSGCRCPVLQVLDADFDQHIHDNTNDEISHFTFINAYPGFERGPTRQSGYFLTVPSSQATCAQHERKYLLP